MSRMKKTFSSAAHTPRRFLSVERTKLLCRMCLRFCINNTTNSIFLHELLLLYEQASSHISWMKALSTTFLGLWTYLCLSGKSASDQPNNLAEGHFPPHVTMAGHNQCSLLQPVSLLLIRGHLSLWTYKFVAGRNQPTSNVFKTFFFPLTSELMGFYIHLFHVSSSYCFLCLARYGFWLLPSFRWDALRGIFSTCVQVC